MQGEPRKRWQEFCELAAKEPDPQRLVQFVAEMNRLFDTEQTEQGKKKSAGTAKQPIPIHTRNNNMR
jgi:hypothetical protein